MRHPRLFVDGFPRGQYACARSCAQNSAGDRGVDGVCAGRGGHRHLVLARGAGLRRGAKREWQRDGRDPRRNFSERQFAPAHAHYARAFAGRGGHLRRAGLDEDPAQHNRDPIHKQPNPICAAAHHGRGAAHGLG